VSLTEIEVELRHRARELIHQGLLPCTSSLDTWGGPATAELCSLCKQPITRDDLEYEVEDRFTLDVRIYRFHFSCHAAWQFECAHQEHLIKAR
jgi:hypothetical protein